MKRTTIVILILAALATVPVVAQVSLQKGMGVIIYADGDEVSVYRANALKTYAVSSGQLDGMTLEAGDLVQTGPGTMLEIQLLPSQSVVKVAENTSFRFTGLNTPTGTTLDVLYGRIKAKVDVTLGSTGFAIRSKTAVAAVRGTEFGYDVIAVPGVGQEPAAQIYSFSGTLAVYPLSSAADSPGTSDKGFDIGVMKSATPIEVPAGAMVSVFDAPDTKALDTLGKSQAGAQNLGNGRAATAVIPLKPSIKNYWQSRADQGVPLPADTIQERFYGLKTAAAEPAGMTGTATPAAAEPVAAAKEPPVPSRSSAITVADTIEPFSVGRPLDLVGSQQYAMVEEPLKLVGMILTGVGFAGSIGGAVFYNFGTDFGMTSYDAQVLGTTSMSSAGALILGGLVCYIIGLFQSPRRPLAGRYAQAHQFACR